jgi:cytohesin
MGNWCMQGSTAIVAHRNKEERITSKGLLQRDIRLSLNEEEVEMNLTHESKEEKILNQALVKFNINPKRGINYLIDNGLLYNTPRDIAKFLLGKRIFHDAQGNLNTGLNKRKVGEYLGVLGNNDSEIKFHAELLYEFLKLFNFQGVTLDVALRQFLCTFRLPGEAQVIDRLMMGYATRYHYNNPGMFSCEDTVYKLSFSLILLNTDLHNPNVKDKMTLYQFIDINRDIDNGESLDRNILQHLYNNIKEEEIVTEVETDVVAFFNPRKQGWLSKKGMHKTWNRRWFIVNGNVLYYFRNRRETLQCFPSCILPLECCTVEPRSETNLVIVNPSGMMLKTVKRKSNGELKMGRHRELVLQADSQLIRDEWIKALRYEIVVDQPIIVKDSGIKLMDQLFVRGNHENILSRDSIASIKSIDEDEDDVIPTSDVDHIIVHKEE